ncbi:MAG: CPBP family intramembrane metalloprotease [Oscillospiraceae bacterium]|nr:CPBP family intramembrane metalloprotease [Oscillospiraceae bacterium]
MDEFNENKKSISAEITASSTRVSAMMLLFVLFAFALGGLTDLICSKVFESAASSTAAALTTLIVYSVQYLLIIPVCVAFSNRGSDFKIRSLYRKPECSAGFAFKWIIIGFALMQTVNLIMNVLFTVIQTVTGKDFFEPNIGTFGSKAEIAVSFFVMVIYAPVFEELMCRGAVYKNFHRFGPWFTIVISGVLFGLMHRNYQQIFYACAGGIILCYLCVKTKSIVVPMLMHFFCNILGAFGMVVYSNAGISDTLTYDEMYEKITSSGLFDILTLFGYIILIYGLILTGIILFIIELCCHRESFRLENECPELTKGQKAAALFRSPVTIITLLVYIAVTIINASGILYI